MKKQPSFLISLEKYTWRVVGKSPLPWPYVGAGIVVIVMIVSLMEARYSVVGVRSEREVIEGAASVGDYATANNLWNVHKSQITNSQILGAETELENLIYPDKEVEERITETEELLKQYPGHRDILLELAGLHEKIGNTEQAQEYWEQARVLDPNNPIFAK